MVAALLWLGLAGLIIGASLLALVVRAETLAVRGEARAASALIVPGARVKPDGTLSTTLHYRLNSALALYRAGYAPLVVVCGGRGDDEPCTEADAMAAYLIEHGVPESAIVREDTSRDTRRNMENAHVLLSAQGVSDVLVVTSDYHLARALYLARQAGFTAAGSASRTPELGYLWFMRVREILGWAKVFAGW